MLEKRVALSIVMTAAESHQVAAYVLFKARDFVISSKECLIEETWPDSLAQITRVSISQIAQISRTLLKAQREISDVIKSERAQNMMTLA